MATSTTARKRNAPPVPEEAPYRRQPQPSKLKRFLRTILLLLIVIVASVGGTLYYTWPAGAELLGLSSLVSDDPVVVQAEPERAPAPITQAPPTAGKPIFSQLEPFTVTISEGGTRSRIMHVAITLQVEDEASVNLLRDYNPVVRDRVLKILSEQNSNYVQTPEGRAQLVDALIHELSQSYGRGTSTLRIENLLFTAFVIQ